MPDIRKKSIVWYYHIKRHEWLRGKVIAVNRWGLTIKQHHNRGTYFLSWMQPAVPASQPKPGYIPPLDWLELERERELLRINHYGVSKKARLLKNMGFLR